MPNNKQSNYQEIKKTICKNYLKDACPYGKDCKFRHPKLQEKKNELCSYYLQNKCKRGPECPFLHQKPKAEKPQRQDWLTFCLYFPSRQCKNKECRFLHITEEEKDIFRRSGKIGQSLVDQGMCKALLQDVSLDGTTPLCKDHLQSHCEWMSCPLLHLNQKEYFNVILDMLREKFEAVLGPCEGYHAVSKSAYSSSYNHQEPRGHTSQFYNGRGDRYPSKNDEPYGVGYEKNPNWYGRGDYSKQDFISSETERIIEGVYNLMKKDTSLLRNPENYEFGDLRMKLNHLAEDNARYRYEFGRLPETEYYKPSVPGTDDYKYQDIVRRLERENVEMRRQLSALQERDQNYYTAGYSNHQDAMNRGAAKGRYYPSYDQNMYGMSSHGASYNPMKQKVNSRLKQNMLTQYKNPSQTKYSMSQYGKPNYPKYSKQSQFIKKKPQQKKTLNPKAGFNQMKSSSIPKTIPKEDSSEKDRESVDGDEEGHPSLQDDDGNVETNLNRSEAGEEEEEEEKEMEAEAEAAEGDNQEQLVEDKEMHLDAKNVVVSPENDKEPANSEAEISKPVKEDNKENDRIREESKDVKQEDN